MKIQTRYREQFNYTLKVPYSELLRLASDSFPKHRMKKGFLFSGLYGRTIIKQGNANNKLHIILDMSGVMIVWYYFWMLANIIAEIFMIQSAIRAKQIEVIDFIPLIFIVVGFFFFLLLSISEASIFKDDFEKFLRRKKLVVL